MPGTLHLVVSIISILAIAIFAAFCARKDRPRISFLGGLAAVLILASLLFGRDAVTGYGLLGAGALLAIWDIVSRCR